MILTSGILFITAVFGTIPDIFDKLKDAIGGPSKPREHYLLVLKLGSKIGSIGLSYSISKNLLEPSDGSPPYDGINKPHVVTSAKVSLVDMKLGQPILDQLSIPVNLAETFDALLERNLAYSQLVNHRNLIWELAYLCQITIKDVHGEKSAELFMVSFFASFCRYSISKKHDPYEDDYRKYVSGINDRLIGLDFRFQLDEDAPNYTEMELEVGKLDSTLRVNFLSTQHLYGHQSQAESSSSS